VHFKGPTVIAPSDRANLRLRAAALAFAAQRRFRRPLMAISSDLSLFTRQQNAAVQQNAAGLASPLVVSKATAVSFSCSTVANDVVGTRHAASAAESWDALVEGRMTIVGHAVDETHASLLVRMQPTQRTAPCSIAHAATLESVLTGRAQKVVVVDFDISPATATGRLTSVLRGLGLTSSVRRVPLALAMVASSHALGAAFSPRGYQAIPSHDADSVELRMPRPETALRPWLSCAEYEVLRAVVAGHSHAEVGNLRDRSPRTIANQLRSIAAKLGVCGRFQYINLAMRAAIETTEQRRAQACQT
jgi:DNA-binding NarL/FixJ family response regulator